MHKFSPVVAGSHAALVPVIAHLLVIRLHLIGQVPRPVVVGPQAALGPVAEPVLIGHRWCLCLMK